MVDVNTVVGDAVERRWNNYYTSIPRSLWIRRGGGEFETAGGGNQEQQQSYPLVVVQEQGFLFNQ